jgi:FkbM family methyltransferase
MIEEVMPMVSFRLPNGQTIWHLPGTGQEVLFLYKECVTDAVYLRHGIELEDGGTVLDVGANIGLFTLSLLMGRTRLRVLCFEPAPETRRCLEKNIAAALCEREGAVDIMPCALGAEDGSAQITYLPFSPANSTFYPELKRRELESMFGVHDPAEPPTKSAAEGVDRSAAVHAAPRIPKPLMRVALQKLFETQMRVECPMARLSSLIRSQRLERIDLLKIDVEGAEFEILRGIDDEHWPHIRQLAMECSVWNKGHLPTLEQELRQRGFKNLWLETYLSSGSALDNGHPCMVYARR